MRTSPKLRICLIAISFSVMAAFPEVAHAHEDPRPLTRISILEDLEDWLAGIFGAVTGRERYSRAYEKAGPEHEPIGQPETGTSDGSPSDKPPVDTPTDTEVPPQE